MASSCALGDVWGWITNLPPINQWDTNTMSFAICTFGSKQPSLTFSIIRSLQSQPPCISFSISTNFQFPISLWTSDSFYLRTKTIQSLDDGIMVNLFLNIINRVLKYGPNKKYSFTVPTVQLDEDFGSIFNLAFVTLALLVSIYEAPQDLRLRCSEALVLQLTTSESREAFEKLVRVLGFNIEEQWMRSLNLTITNWIAELQGLSSSFRLPSPLFSYASSANRQWKVQLYFPTIAMHMEDSSSATHDHSLLFSLNYHHLEAVIQFAYKVIFRDNSIEVVVSVDNIRLDVNPLVSEHLMAKRGYGSEEKHFPSAVSLQLTPTLQTDIVSVSVSKSSDNPEIKVDKGIEVSFEPSSTLGLKVTASETVTVSMKPWKFEQSVYGDSVRLNWFLNGREVCSSRPSKLTLCQPRAWFRDRYSMAYRPFTKQGGVVFAGDEYGDSVQWKLSGGAEGKIMEWEIKGCLWLTYWPNLHLTFHSETRRVEFRELLQIPLTRIA